MPDMEDPLGQSTNALPYDNGGWLPGVQVIRNDTGHDIPVDTLAELTAKLDMLTEEVEELKRRVDEDD